MPRIKVNLSEISPHMYGHPKEEQEIAAACKVLIQNAVVLWNYLYLSQLVANINDLKERKRMFELIRKVRHDAA